MPVFLDPIVFELRGGPEAHKFGDPWLHGAVIRVEHDRRVFISLNTATWLTKEQQLVVGTSQMRFALETIRELRRLAGEYGWTEIFWVRKEDGAERVVRVPIARTGRKAV